MEKNMMNANPGKTTKIKTHHARIVVDGTAEKPYYSIEWFDPIKKEYYLGYSSYYIANVFNWLSECFEIVEAPNPNANRNEVIRALKCCIKDEDMPCEGNCPYCGEEGCVDKVMADALELLEGSCKGGPWIYG